MQYIIIFDQSQILAIYTYPDKDIYSYIYKYIKNDIIIISMFVLGLMKILYIIRGLLADFWGAVLSNYGNSLGRHGEYITNVILV